VEFAQQEAQAAFGGGGDVGEEEFSGRCAVILANGKRCPNASLPGTRFCGIAAHQELASKSPEELVGQVVPVGGPPLADDAEEDADGTAAEDAANGGEPVASALGGEAEPVEPLQEESQRPE
jgi:N utilization substance protein A